VTRRRTKPAPPAPAPTYPKVIETYREPWLRGVVRTEPSAFDGDVRIRRYRITVELIEEPIGGLRDRLRKLWREDEPNHHHWAPMRKMAKEIGMDPNELNYDEHGIDHKPERKP
jgi:hypothetical protein